MRILAVTIQNFRGIAEGEVRFHAPHLLLAGSNNAGKSTVLEALDLALNPDRSYGSEIIDEHDFYQGKYLRPSATDAPPKISITVTLGELEEDEHRSFKEHRTPWNHVEFRPRSLEENDRRPPEPHELVLQVGFEGWYDEEEDEFKTESFFLVPEEDIHGERKSFGKKRKQEVGFLYLRALRTARRAASLQRGSLLDLLLRTKASKTNMWQKVLDSVTEAGAGLAEVSELTASLADITERIDQLIPLSQKGPSSALHAGRLTRRDLRESMTYFLASRDSEHLLPFDRLGAGTSNVLVFALLTAIAKAKDNVIFAMEEPEIALAPHTQRVMVQRLQELASQSIVTSHSPYVAELFLPDDLVVATRDGGGKLEALYRKVDPIVKEKNLRKHFRTRFAEGLLGRAVAVVEGETEVWAIPAAAENLAQVPDTHFTSFDVEGLIFLDAGSDSALDLSAGYFMARGIPTHIVSDHLPPARMVELQACATSAHAHPHGGFEDVLAQELSLTKVKELARECRGWERFPTQFPTPDEAADEPEWRQHLLKVLSKRKGDGWAARMIELCEPHELPPSLIQIIAHLRQQLGLPALPHEDPLAAIFRAVAPSAVQQSPEQLMTDAVPPDG